jgi:hypothetical protein
MIPRFGPRIIAPDLTSGTGYTISNWRYVTHNGVKDKQVLISVAQIMESRDFHWWYLPAARILLTGVLLHLMLMLAQILRIYGKLNFPVIYRHILLFVVAYAMTLAYIVADVFDHLPDPLTWRMPFVIVLVTVGNVAVRNLRNYFRSAEIGD